MYLQIMYLQIIYMYLHVLFRYVFTNYNNELSRIPIKTILYIFSLNYFTQFYDF